LDSRFTALVLGLRGGIDYTAIAQRKAEREAEESEKAERHRHRAESDAFMKSITARIEEAKQVVLEQAHERVLARRPEWVEEGEKDVPESEDEANDSQESEGAGVQELFRVTLPRPERASARRELEPSIR
jgi:hypothetical protein